jgi:hypothetical protein
MNKNIKAEGERNLSEVIDQMVEVIPKAEVSFIATLASNKSSADFCAPEMVPFWWREVHTTILDYVPSVPVEEWHYQVLSIFSTHPIEEMKKVVKMLQGGE